MTEPKPAAKASTAVGAGCVLVFVLLAALGGILNATGLVSHTTPSPAVTARPTSKSEQVLYADCLQSAADDRKTLQRALDGCSWARPPSVSDQSACMMYTIADLYYHKGYSKDETETAALAVCGKP